MIYYNRAVAGVEFYRYKIFAYIGVVDNNVNITINGGIQMLCEKLLMFHGNNEKGNRYYMLKKDVGDNAIYGIMISNERFIDYVAGVSENRKEVEEILEYFSKNDVSPIHLAEAIDEAKDINV